MIKQLKDLIEKTFENIRKNNFISAIQFPESHQISIPKSPLHGDYATNIALILAPLAGKKPREIAQLFLDILKDNSLFDKIEIAGPGFINFFISKKFWQEKLYEIVNLKGDNITDTGAGKKALVEFVSANPTGPLHVGHGRGAAVGDSLARILKAVGYDARTEYYINDVGNQMNILGSSVYLRYKELLGETIEFPDNYYKGSYIKDIAGEVIESDGLKYKDVPLEDCLFFFRQKAIDNIMQGIKQDLFDFNVHFTNWFSERTLHDSGFVQDSIDHLIKTDFIYEDDGALWFKSSAFGDEKDRVIKKSDGNLTYFAADIAYHRNKIERGFDLLVDIWGSDHHGYIPRVRAVIEALGKDKEKLQVLLVQFVTLFEGGVQKSMSTRSGEFVTLRELLDEVGKDATRFMFLTRKCDSHLDFDLELAKKQTQENPVYYVQYAHARLCSVFRNALEKGIDANEIKNVDTSLFSEEDDIIIIKKLNHFFTVVEESALSLEPHRISHYLTDLAGIFHNYYTKNRFLCEDAGLTNARLFLAVACKTILLRGLKLLGVDAPEKM
jgi:arginyl-tRNA synthetase